MYNVKSTIGKVGVGTDRAQEGGGARRERAMGRG
jgi:hypothetical protein